MYFSISAPQSLAIPDGPSLSFRVNTADSSLVEMHVSVPGGVHVFTFKRNGTLADQSFHEAVQPEPLAGYKSVDDEPVRSAPADTSSPPVASTPVG